MAENKKEKWTELEHLPEWDEEFYEVFTARKHGKWVMLKALRPELRDDPKYREMIGKEFDVRYNLCHPNIVMINDFEEVPGIGEAIITDDVYGDSLARLIEKGECTPEIVEKIAMQLPEAISYIQENHIVHHPIQPSRIIFTDKIRNLKLIDVGFDQKSHLTSVDASEDMRAFGLVLAAAMAAAGVSNPRYQRVIDRTLSSDPRRRFRDVQDMKLALTGDSNRRLYLIIIAFLALMTLILGYLCWQTPSL